MGNRAIITTEKRDLGVYLHWNGGRDSVEAFLKYCDLKGYPSPDRDCYGWARLCQVVGNYFGGNDSLGIRAYTTDRQMYQGDNGIYVIKDWKIVDHVTEERDDDGKFVRMKHFPERLEQRRHDLKEMLYDIDQAQPEKEQLGKFIDAREVPTDSLKIGDKVWLHDPFGSVTEHIIKGFGNGRVNGEDVTGKPWVDGRYGPDNINSYVRTESAYVS